MLIDNYAESAQNFGVCKYFTILMLTSQGISYHKELTWSSFGHLVFQSNNLYKVYYETIFIEREIKKVHTNNDNNNNVKY